MYFGVSADYAFIIAQHSSFRSPFFQFFRIQQKNLHNGVAYDTVREQGYAMAVRLRHVPMKGVSNMPNFNLPDSVFEAAADLYPTPFHLYDEHGIRERARALNKAFAGCADFRE